MHVISALAAIRNAARRARAGEDGFSMVVVMMSIMMLTATAGVAMTAVNGDQGVAQSDLQRKMAYSAAEAGLQAYVHRLTVDASYWTQCTGNNPTGSPSNGDNQTDAVNQYWNGSGNDPRKWAYLPDNSGQYTVEELPANGNSACNKADPVGTVIDDDTATFRVRVTGQALNPNGSPAGPKRSIVATFKRKSFLDYIYFTDLEILDPTLYPARYAPGATATKENPGANDIDGSGQRSLEQWGNQVCAKYAYVPAKNGKFRNQQQFNGSATPYKAGQFVGGVWKSLTMSCTNADIRFAPDDSVNGPLHTNDQPLICGGPNFGTKPEDAIETAAPGDAAITDVTKSYRTDGSTGCSPAKPDVNFNGSTARTNLGSWLMNQGIIQLPPTNQTLDKEAGAGYTFVGNTRIVLNGGLMVVSGGVRQSDGAVMNNTPMAFPSNGVVYVKNDTSQGCTPYDVSDPNYYRDGQRNGCGDVWVQGTYNASLTIGAQDDIIITSNITNLTKPGGSALLGLVAQNFVRMQHQVANQSYCATNKDTTDVMTGSTRDPKVDAAILTLAHSFIVDNWWCGDGLGTLTVYGAISQKFRGPVGTGTGKTNNSGYIKSYQYDYRLRTLSPPKFLDPVKASWRLKTYQEQSPAT